MNTAFVSATPLSTRTFTTHSFSTTRPSSHPTVARSRSTPVAIFDSSSDENANKVREAFERVQSAVANAYKGLALMAMSMALAILPFSDHALAARSGGRVGGSQFRSAPSRVAPSPSRGYGGGYSGGYGGYGYGGGYGGPGIFLNPFVMPFGGYGIGFGGLGTLVAVAIVASYVSDRLRSSSPTEGEVKTGLSVVKVGLLSSAREVQIELENMTRNADTATIEGLTYVIQTSATTLLRHPDYWMYASGSSTVSTDGQTDYNRLALEQRLKVQEETLTNTAGINYEKQAASASTEDMSQAPKEYIVVSFVVATDSPFVSNWPKSINSTADLRKALTSLAALPAESLQAVEIIWAPQSYRDSLTQREMLEDHPELKQL